MLLLAGMWLANALTLSRLPLALVFWWVADRPVWAFVVLVVAAATDVADGRLARRARRRRGIPESTRTAGAWLDPLCDKTFVVVALAAAWWRADAPLPLIAIIGTRELVLLPMLLVFRLAPATLRVRYDFKAGRMGKAATIAQFVALLGLLAGWPDGGLLAGLAGVLGLVAAWTYLQRGLELARHAGDVPARPPGPLPHRP